MCLFTDDSASILGFHTNSTSISRCSSDSSIFTRKTQSQISKYAVCNFNKSKIPKFYDLLIRMTVANGWAFQWVNDPSTREFFRWLNPN